MPTTSLERVKKSQQARVAKGERRIFGFLDAETAAMLDVYVEQSGSEKQEVLRTAIRRFVSEQLETTAA
jgi:hypothetical protein